MPHKSNYEKATERIRKQQDHSRVDRPGKQPVLRPVQRKPDKAV